MDDQLTLSLPRRLLSYLICSLIAFQPLLPAFSAVITPATQGTQVDAAGNGVPVINIATPNASGLSHNQYQNYNVGQEGLILNNATDRLTQTQLGGLIQNNPNLKAGQEARAIINEVVGANRSQLQGYTEVAGKAANVMVANPYGITCNGCGFINTPNVTLTTGKPQLDAQGNLQSLDVTKGAISIEGKGLDGSQADAVSIIARATEINAGIHARDLNVTLGTNRVGADGSVTPIADEGAAPSVAVDTGALGGMYANRIHLVSSENGVGVNLGNLNARQGDMVLDAQGRLSINNSLTSGTLTAKGSSIALQGEHKAGGNVALTAQQDIALTGAKLGSDTALDLNSQGQITLKGSSLTSGQTARLSGHTLDIDNSSSGSAADAMQLSATAQLQNSGQLTAAKKLDLQAAQIVNSGSLISQGDLQVRTSTLQQQGMLLAQGNNSVVAGQLSNGGEISGSSLNVQSGAINNGGKLLSTGDALITADSMQQRGTLSASNTNQLNVTGTLNNSGEVSGSSLKIHSGALLNSGNMLGSQQTDITSGILQQDGTLSSQGRLQLKVVDRLSNSGELSGNSLDITSGTLDNSGKMISSGDALLTANRLNQDGTLSAQGNAALNIADTFSNSGNMVSQRLQIDAPTLINSGEMMSHGDVVMNADTLQQNGSLTARGDAQLTARGWLENQGAISSQNALILNSAQLRNTGSLTALNLTLTAGQITNSGLLQGTKLLSFHTGQLDNLAAGTISSDNDFALALPQLNNSGLITSGKTLTVTGDRLNNSGEINAASLSTTLKNLHNQQGGTLLADDQLRLQGDALINQGMMAAGTLNSDVSQITNSGTVQGDKALSLQGNTLTNNGTLLSAGQLGVKQQTLENSGLMQGKQLTVNADRWQNSGNALSETDADLQSDTLVNSGKILGQQGITLKSDHTDNSGWLIAQALTLRGDMINSGLIQGNQKITLQGSQLDNQQGGQLLSDGTLDGDVVALNNHGAMQAGEMTLNAGTLQNDGTVLTGKAFTAVINGALTNSGSLLSQQQMNLQAAEIDNQGKLAADNLSLHAPVLSNAGLLQGNSTLLLDHQQLHNLNGAQLIAGGPLTLTLDQLDNAGLLQVNGKLAVNGNRLNNSGRLLSDNLTLQIGDTLMNSGTGQIVTGQQADLQAQTLSNSGQIAAQQLSASGNTLENGGLLQGDALLDLGFAQNLNHNNGQLLSGDRLIVSGGSATNDGSWQGQQLDVTLDSLTNRGSINGISALRADITSDLINSGSLVSLGESDLNASTLRNSGKVMANRLGLQTTSLNNDGLLQGNTVLTAQADNITQSAGGKTLSGGTLTLNAGQINTQGLLQGEQATIIADNWLHQGSLLGSKDLNVSISNELHNTGSLLSQDKAQVAAGTLNNSGSLLSEGAMMLNGAALNNSGSVQGKTLTITPGSVINQGSLIGLQALTFAAMPQVSGRMLLRALAAPARQLINNQGGSLLTQGTLNISGDDVVNNGSWQGQQILLNARQLTNNGAIQSADALQLILADRLAAGAGSKISANGTAALQALTLTNQGEWIARNLTLRGDTLNNNGAVTGVEALTVGLNGALTQQQDKTLLSAGRLTLQASSLNNAGRVQGGDLQITSGAVDNNGRLQGDNSLLVNAGGRITNGGSGTLITQNALTLTGPELFNYGLIQGSGNGVATITGLTQNDGRWLSGGAQTLNTPQLNNNGWLQASQLILNATNASNNGTLLADGQGTLTGNGFSNQGTAQGGNLEVNYQQLNNSGTLLGNNRLSVMAAQVGQQGSGRLFSGGDLLVHSNGFDQSGQVVALGNATLEIANGFTGRDVLAAGGRLTVSSNGAIDNQGTMQGGALTLSAGGDLTNNGQLTTGSGDSALSGNRIAMNGNGSLQGGGNITLNSRSDITVDGFTGTLGNLTLSAPGSIVNTALLYAGNNLSLFANSIKNQRGDVLAGNSMWLQGDAAGNANGEVINTSGTIESQDGDITINTGHLLNTRDGLSTHEGITQLATPSWAKGTNVRIPFSWFKPSDYYKYVSGTQQHHGHGDDWETKTYSYAPNADVQVQKVAYQSIAVTANASGGAGRIAAGENLNVQAAQLDNSASSLLARNNMALSGTELNNQSWTDGTTTVYQIYRYNGGATSSSFNYTLDGSPVFETTGSGNVYRSVIQAGNNIDAVFSQNISNTSSDSHVIGTINTLATPGLARLSQQSISGGVQNKSFSSADKMAVNSPEWKDQLQNALQQIIGGSQLDTTSDNNVSLTQNAVSQKGHANLGSSGVLKDASGSLVPSSLKSYQAKNVDSSAYPVPASDNGYFVISTNPSSRYLITVNPKLNGLGQLDQSLFGELNAKLGNQPATTPLQETRPQYTDEKAFLGSSYMLDRLNLKPDYDYRFLGDAAFDTRYVSNAVLNQTGNRYINGLGSDLAQMRYLMDNAAAAQQSLGLEFGVSLSAEQLASLDKSMVWWEATTINGETVMVPKLYLSTKDVEVRDGSVIAGNNVTLNGGNVTNTGSSVMAKNDLTIDSQNTLSNLNAGLLHAGGDLQLSALNDINNVSATISGKKVELESLNGDINNLTTSQLWHLDADNDKGAKKSYTETLFGPTASITSLDSLSLKAGNNIAVTGANLKAGGDLLLNAWNDIAITGNQNVTGSAQSGSGNRWQKVDATSTTTVNTVGSQIAAGGNMAMQAGHDLTVTASSINAGKNAALAAGNDLNLNSASTSQNDVKGKRETHSTGLDRTTLTSGGDLALQAGRDINSQAAGIAADKDVTLQAGHDVNLLAAETGSGNSYKSGKKIEINESVRQQGTEIASGGSTTVKAGRDMIAEAARVDARGDLAVQAGRDVAITTATESDYHYDEDTKVKKKLFSKKTIHTVHENSATTEQSSALSGNNVTIVAGRDLGVTGSSVVGDNNVALKAGRELAITAATEEEHSYSLKETKKSGMMSGGSIGVTFGSASTRQQLNRDGTTQSQSASAVGSTGGSVTLIAGNNAHISGSDVIAKKDISVVGGSVDIDTGNDLVSRRQVYEQKKSGLTLQLTSPITDALLSLGEQAKSASEAGDGRLKALGAVKALESGWAMSGGKAMQSGQALANGNMNQAGIKIELSVGASKSKSSSEYNANAVKGSSLNGGGNIAVVATGANGSSGDITLSGSGITGKNVTLAAAHDLNLTAATNNTEQKSSNKASGWSGGVHVAIGKETGIGVQASGFMASGKENGKTTDYVNSRVNASNDLTLSSGNDTVLSGAQALGNRIVADVGHDLTMTSLQDTDDYQSKQQSASGGFSFTFGSMTGSAGLSLSQSKVNSEYASVGDQSGLFAGNGGYDIYVGNHTQLNGAVIASTAQSANNALSTGTLGWSDIDNHASYKASSSSISMGGGNEDNKMSGSAIPTSANTQGSASGTTRAAVADGTITVRNGQAQTQNVADLSRDTDNANGHIDKIFDKDKVARKLEFAQGIQELGQRVAGDVSSYKMQAAEDETRERLLKANPQLAGYSTDALNTLIVNDPGYKAVAEKWGTGGSYSMAAAAVTGVLGGLGASNLGAAAAGGMAPYIANEIKHATSTFVDGQEQTNVLANTMAHAVAGAVLAQLAGNNATAGAAGAAGGELMARSILNSMYPGKQASELTQEQKQVVSALGQLAAQLSAGVASGSVEGGIQGAVAGKNAVENNALSPGDFGQGMADYAQAQTSLGTSMIQSGASADEISAALAKAAQGDMPEGQDAAKGLLIAWAEFFGVPVSALTADGEMTPQRAAEILASGIPASEAKLVQYVAAKAYLTIAKSADLGLSAENQKYVDILSPEAKQHILYGDSPTQGGHLYPGNPGKTVFPQSWSADKVVHVVGDIATSPDTQWFAQTGTGEAYTKAGKPARWVAWSEQDGVIVRVVYEPASGKIVTAFPDSNPTPPTLKPIKK
ncbi:MULTISPECIES: hemagglutinin repeat-containing protein [unclassified Pantoea]|uniref:hemagglutinin repeat-containing protein n=1 Tax=unclassified Pantoea TaxID=2630326 RepID=UPI0024779661|nr:MULTISPECIES: hemagglutinin repeat-containing protein [unclassified Pantoea]GME30519.1 hemagglutinin repeat-containing protein [Pantoea sp. QMID3]GME30829.1 hemagglutinin repeat-containing protein [Pantoea sp. QMID1]GME50705.1 hemagglutinin repeat-containing protein [Pantoea sp. QMID4]GME51978.1 hemagglutinin repeat-containing protein [Pantoea sp. QMID2]